MVQSAQDDLREYSTSTPTNSIGERRGMRQRRKSEEEIYASAAPPTAKRRFKKPMRATVSQPDLAVVHSDWENIPEEDEDDEEEELEPKLEFPLRGSPKARVSSTSQSTETIPPGNDPFSMTILVISSLVNQWILNFDLNNQKSKFLP